MSNQRFYSPWTFIRVQDEVRFDQDACAPGDHFSKWPSFFFKPAETLGNAEESFVHLTIRVCRGGKRRKSHTSIGEHLTVKVDHCPAPFFKVTWLTTGRHLLAIVRGTCSTNSICRSRPGRLAVTVDSIFRRLSSPNPFLGTIMSRTE